MGIRISDLSAKGSKIASTDIMEVSVVSGPGYVSRYITGSQINELSLDTSPQLGGNLDVNGNIITSASNGDIEIKPNGSGDVIIGDVGGAAAAQLKLSELSSNGTNYISFKAPDSLASNTAYTLPSADGTKGQYLQTDGGGTLSWAAIQYTVELIDALTVDFYAPYNLQINSVTNILNSPTTTILDDGASYTLGATIASGSKITVTVNTAAVVTLNVEKV